MTNKHKIENKLVYAHNQKEALRNFRRLTPNKFVAIRAKRFGVKNGVPTYLVYYKLRRGEY